MVSSTLKSCNGPKRPRAQLPSNCARSATPSTTAAGCTGDGKPDSEDRSSDCGGKAASRRLLRPLAWSRCFGVACFAAAFFAASPPAASAAALEEHGAAVDWSHWAVASVVAAVAVISAALMGCVGQSRKNGRAAAGEDEEFCGFDGTATASSSASAVSFSGNVFRAALGVGNSRNALFWILMSLSLLISFATFFSMESRPEGSPSFPHNDLSSPQCEEYKADATVASLEPDPKFAATQEYQEMQKYIEKNYDFKKLKQDFITKGYVVYKPEIPDNVLNGATEFTEQVLTRCATGGVTPADDCRDFHQDRFTDIDSVRDLAQNYDIRAMLASLHGYEPYPFQTLNYPKSSLARTHSDYIHFAAHPLPLMSAAWVALQDIDPNSGPVFYYEGSHVINPFNMQDFGLEDRTKGPLNYAKYQDIVTAHMNSSFFPYKQATIPKGWVLIWSSNLVHGGPPAKNSALPRLSQVTHYFFRNSNYNWAPVASDVDNDAVSYYDEEAVNRKWGRSGTAKERRAMSKFKIGKCNLMTKNTNVPNPCMHHHKIPKVLSEILVHKGENGNDVIM